MPSSTTTSSSSRQEARNTSHNGHLTKTKRAFSSIVMISGTVLFILSIGQYGPYSQTLPKYLQTLTNMNMNMPGNRIIPAELPLVDISDSAASMQPPSSPSQTRTVATRRKAYTFNPNALGDKKINIRSWGCERRREAPLIFVHIGKAGGGSVRARLAASALHYNRTRWSDVHQDSTYYYPMHDPDDLFLSNHTSKNVVRAPRKGILVNSGFNNFRPSFPRSANNATKRELDSLDKYWKSFEKTLPCSAETPLGQAIACPLVETTEAVQKACRGRHCNIVYTGHNLLGNEMHWLPTNYLVHWWQSTPWNQEFLQQLETRRYRWHRPNPNNNNNNNNNNKTALVSSSSSCHFGKQQKRNKKHPHFFYKQNYFDCVAPWEEAIDEMASSQALRSKQAMSDWSPIYASLPVLRVTMIREPFSWLVSKFFWHQGNSGHLMGRNGTKAPLYRCDADYESIADWASPAANKYMQHLCGEDCVVRMHTGQMTLEQAETQARHNLQHSFAVVGLLNETETFYEMITARAAYMNTSLNPEVTGGMHSTSTLKEYHRCKEVYETEEFQQNLLQASPELAVLHRLYQVGLQVNRFQLQEMKSCGIL